MSAQLPPRNIAPQIIDPQAIASRIIVPEDDCPLGKLPPPRCQIIAPWMIVLGLLLVDNYLKNNWLLTIPPWKLLRREIAFRMICCLHKCPSEKWPQGKLPRREIVPRINYTRDIFSPVIKNRSTLIDSCFLLRSFFINTVRLKLLKKEKQVKNKLSME